MFQSLIISVCFFSTFIYAAIPSYSGYKLTWADDFIGNLNSKPNINNWIFDVGTQYPSGAPAWGTGEVQIYTTSYKNIKLDGRGNLQITPIRNGSGVWTSARIETKRTDFAAAAGGVLRIEAKIRLPQISGETAAGYWPAFWSLGSAYRGNYQNWPGIGEIDIMEQVNGRNAISGGLHCGTNPGGPCNEPNGLAASISCPGSSCQGHFHVYRAEINRSIKPEAISWSIDGQVYNTLTESQVGSTTWKNSVQNGKFLLLNLAMGGSYPNGVAGSSTPTSKTQSGASMFVDYVAVYHSA